MGRSPSSRFSAFGGIYPAYESVINDQQSFFFGHGKSEFALTDDLYNFMITDIRGIHGAWNKSILFFLKNLLITIRNLKISI